MAPLAFFISSPPLTHKDTFYKTSWISIRCPVTKMHYNAYFQSHSQHDVMECIRFHDRRSVKLFFFLKSAKAKKRNKEIVAIVSSFLFLERLCYFSHFPNNIPSIDDSGKKGKYSFQKRPLKFRGKKIFFYHRGCLFLFLQLKKWRIFIPCHTFEENSKKLSTGCHEATLWQCSLLRIMGV